MSKKLITPPGVRAADGSQTVDLSGLPLPQRVAFLAQRMETLEKLGPVLLMVQQRVDLLERLGRLVHLVVPLVAALERAGLIRESDYLHEVGASMDGATADAKTSRALTFLRALADRDPPDEKLRAQAEAALAQAVQLAQPTGGA